MRKFLVPLAALLIISALLIGCTKTTTPAQSTAPPVTTTATSTAPTSTVPTVTTTRPTATVTTTGPTVTATTTAPKPTLPGVSGGTLRVIAAAGPQVLGGFEGGPADAGAVFPAVERLMDATKDRSMGNGLEPVLAESVDDDVANKRIVFHLRKGVKFHDGSDFNADVVLWSFQMAIDNNRLQYMNYWDGITKQDDYTVTIKYKEYTNQLIQSWGWWSVYSKVAYEKGSGGDPVKGREWMRNNCVGTGPFILKEYKRDDHLTWVKNPNYWRPGQPYLDAIEVRYIPDAVTAYTLFLSGGADEWDSAPQQQQIDLVKKGALKVSSWPALPMHIWPNTADPNSKWNNKDLRYALEYALDKPKLAQALGFGNYVPMTMLADPGEWGYDPNYPARTYNVAKAKELLKAAGYPNGLKAKLLIPNDSTSQDAGTAIKQYLDAAGFQIELDVADPGRFYGSVWGPQPPAGSDLSFNWSGKDLTFLITYMRWFSTDPFTNLSYLGHTDKQKELDEKAKRIPDVAGQKAATEEIVKYMTDEARLIPMWANPSAVITQPWVHSDRFSQGFIRWQSENTWMDKR